jgi:hypothetical protein
MDTLHQQIVSKFLSKLADSKQVDVGKIQQLRQLLTDNKKPKADDFIKLFTLPAGEDIK